MNITKQEALTFLVMLVFVCVAGYIKGNIDRCHMDGGRWDNMECKE